MLPNARRRLVEPLSDLLVAADANDNTRRTENPAASVGYDFAFQRGTLRTRQASCSRNE